MMNHPTRPVLKSNDARAPELAVAVLAGGASSRFGEDKALVRLCREGPTLLERTVSIGLRISPDTVVIGHEWYEGLELGVPVVPDRFPGAGPLAGVHTALSATSANRLMVLACDAPCLSFELLQAMASWRADASLLLPRTADGRWHPMPGVYHRGLRADIEAVLAEGERAIVSLIGRVTVDAFPEAELRRLDPMMDSLFSLNSPEQIERARRCVTCN